AVFGTVAPVTIDSRPRTLTLAHQEEAAALTAAVLLGRVIERDVAFVAGSVSLSKVDAVFVGPATVGLLTVAFDAVDRRRGVRVAGHPDARGLLIVRQQQIFH